MSSITLSFCVCVCSSAAQYECVYVIKKREKIFCVFLVPQFLRKFVHIQFSFFRLYAKYNSLRYNVVYIFSNSLIQYKFLNGDEFFNIWTPYGIILITRYFLFKFYLIKNYCHNKFLNRKVIESN